MTGDRWTRSDVVWSDGRHNYWSTHCRHDNHDACAATELAPGVPRRPAQCKTCAAPCRCECHDASPAPRAAGYEQAIATLRGVAERTGSPAARWAADYLDTDPDFLAPRE